MVLTASSISRLIHGKIDDLPLELQVLSIHRLDGDVYDVYVARLKLSDGKNYYSGFVIDVSILESLHLDVYAILRIEKLNVLKHSEGKYVLQIVQMQLVSQEKECIGEPEPYLWQSTHASASITKRNLLDNSTVPSSVLGQLPAALEVIPVAQISALVSKNVAIEGRVICKSELCRFANGKGKFFTFDVADSSSEIRCKVFNDITDMFVELIVVGQAYHLTNFTINRSNKQYNHLPHDFEINLKKNSVIYQISGDAFKNVNISFNVVKISSISLSDVGRSVDLSVTIKSIGDVENLYVQKNNSYSNRRIVMVSDDSADINIVFWGNLAKNFSAQVHQTILIIYMGNTTSDSLDHSFKRLRLSHTEQLSLASPSSMSPRRKVATNIMQHFSRNLDNTVNDTIDQSPVLSCDKSILNSATTSSPYHSPQPITNKIHDGNVNLHETHIFPVESCTKSIIYNHQTDSEHGELSDEQIMMLLRLTKLIPDLSDSDIIDCLKQEYGKKGHQ
ncbi:unnamed protein product [Rotaria magnacalcarata]|uniref:Replication protein A OB domain-containing protein n=2 Tax=Rotaria magnacalcarata TaxID=392030 RepID=A0A819VI28_9BILA|nr:unnamed protein product [Rotaria magnacalcarata]CAF4143051.1 unnamed protein product [Rotaria magnacalcarata]